MGESDIKSTNPEREARILDAAARLFIRYGYDKTTVAEIAHEAGVSKGAVYLHWENKDALFEALIWREAWLVVENMLDRIEADPDGGTIGGIYKNAALALRTSPITTGLIAMDKLLIGKHLVARNPALVAQKFLSQRQFLVEMKAAGLVRQDVDIETMSFVMNLMSYGMLKIQEIVPEEQIPPLEVLFAQIGEMLDRTLAPEGGIDREAGKRVVSQIITQSRQLFEQYKNPLMKPQR